MMDVFDVEINNWDIVLKCSDEEFIVMEEMRTFVESRIKVLEDEINAEEAADNNMKATVIALKQSKIIPAGYTDKLTQKILGCISVQDTQFMMLKVEEALKRFLN